VVASAPRQPASGEVDAARMPAILFDAVRRDIGKIRQDVTFVFLHYPSDLTSMKQISGNAIAAPNPSK
jgi:hypothetical protein